MEIRELDRKSLTIEQKLGLIICTDLTYRKGDADLAEQMIRERRLGAIWVQPHRDEECEAIRRRLLAAADYPLLVLCDAELGYGDYRIPDVNAFSAVADGERTAYAFGRRSAASLRREGYNVICNPILDLAKNARLPCGGNTRSFGADRDVIVRLAGAMARGMHAGGTLVVAKHYPFARSEYDTHMREGLSNATREEITEVAMYAFRHLVGEGLIDGIMTGHIKFPNVDPDNPTSLSAPMIALARELGFDGFATTDALNMMGILAKHGRREPCALAIRAGNDLPLNMGLSLKDSYEGLLEAYRRGDVTDEMVERALDRVLAAQHKAAMLPRAPELYPEDLAAIEALHGACISAVCAEGVSPTISREGRHLFTVVTNERADEKSAEYTPGPRDWFFPRRIAARLRELFPNSETVFLPVNPEGVDNAPYLHKQVGFDDVVFITNYQTTAYTGREHLTVRIQEVMDAMQATDRIVAHLHFGNPYVASDAPFVPRILLGYSSEACVYHALEILAGNAPALGHCPYEINFHKKGESIW